MLKNLFKSRVLKFIILIVTMFVLTRIPASAAIPNLDGDTHPNRLKLSECLIDLKKVANWDGEQASEAARRICELRQDHAKQKARFLASQDQLTKIYKDSSRFKEYLPTAITDSWQIVKSCIDFKEGFTSTHNIEGLTLPEQIRSQCYSLSADFIESHLSVVRERYK
ncbi:hypothetical protein [uncultured Nostoc sp.]|uniref:hypothetical protein n=1 Tax=uncultured Nostoc sp. TaxID=340711 RepID=UPI00262D9AAC|nr:hypothetical protein [uncultured Nostoc sp.]